MNCKKCKFCIDTSYQEQGFCEGKESTPEQKMIDCKNKLLNIFDGLYSCSRVWEAWNYGTMDRNDFTRADEDDQVLGDFEELLKDYKLYLLNELLERGKGDPIGLCCELTNKKWRNHINKLKEE